MKGLTKNRRYHHCFPINFKDFFLERLFYKTLVAAEIKWVGFSSKTIEKNHEVFDISNGISCEIT